MNEHGIIDPFKVLGLDKKQLSEMSNEQTLDMVRTAYRMLSKMYHPDRNEDKDNVSFQVIATAYEVLMYPDRILTHNIRASWDMGAWSTLRKESNPNINVNPPPPQKAEPVAPKAEINGKTRVGVFTLEEALTTHMKRNPNLYNTEDMAKRGVRPPGVVTWSEGLAANALSTKRADDGNIRYVSHYKCTEEYNTPGFSFGFYDLIGTKPPKCYTFIMDKPMIEMLLFTINDSVQFMKLNKGSAFYHGETPRYARTRTKVKGVLGHHDIYINVDQPELSDAVIKEGLQVWFAAINPDSMKKLFSLLIDKKVLTKQNIFALLDQSQEVTFGDQMDPDLIRVLQTICQERGWSQRDRQGLGSHTGRFLNNNRNRSYLE